MATICAFSAHHGPIPIDLERWPINRKWIAGRACRRQGTVACARPARGRRAMISRKAGNWQRNQGQRTVLSVPLLREGESIGAISLRRIEVQPFSDKQIALAADLSPIRP